MHQTGRVTEPVTAIILAAGAGTRMQSDLPKPLHLVGGRPMIDWVTDALRDDRITAGVVVVGHGGEKVIEHLAYLHEGHTAWGFVTQAEQLGTGHAALLAIESLGHPSAGDALILPGDTPLLRSTSIARLLDEHTKSGAALSVLSAVVDEPTGYGRILRDESDHVRGIVEERDASPAQRGIREINTGIMVGSILALDRALERVGRTNAQGEYYLTDVIGILVNDGRLVRAVKVLDPLEAKGVNDPEQLASCEKALAERGVN